MKATVLCLFALLGAAGTAKAGEPLVLTEAQLDEVTGGKVTEEYRGIVILTTNLKAAIDKEVSVNFTAAEQAGENDRFLGGFNSDSGVYVKTVPPDGFGFQQ
jgi:hypothetical protein